MTTGQQGRQPGTQDGAGEPGGPDGFVGVQPQDAQELAEAVRRLMDKHVTGLRRLQIDAEGRLQLATVERQQLERFLDEVGYRVRFRSETATTPETALDEWQVQIQGQEQALRERLAEVQRTQVRLDQLVQRLTGLVRQTQGLAQRVEAPEGAPGAQDPWALELRAQLIQGQEAERARLAREIHDGPAQALTNTLLRLQFLENLLQHHPDQAAAELASSAESVRASLQDVRRFIFNLRPASLQDAGLVGTLERLIREYRQYTGLDVQATLPGDLELPPEQELVVFRVVQEALHNVQKHADAGRVLVEIMRRPAAWIVIVADNGRGFERAAVAGQSRVGSGLVSMHERAVSIGATLDVSSGPGRGTRLTLTIPAADPAAARADFTTKALSPVQEVTS